MSHLYSNQETYDCCFNGNVLETCQYCGGAARLLENCTGCQGSGTSYRPCPYHSASPSCYSNNVHAASAHRTREVKRSSGKSKNGKGGRTVK
ncbi:hypothetical protein sscle_09g069930 [Sclerotinia sclerotiorum 1980 UF-70]|uniref:Uncharacterized protein n=1 Tax=Sclerotinia sclerotiorum (strain ATCC 18683 / 1980 / Ss-1) TaxID=665079 RepID=A0A1D9QC84_SCLS1|nr:hypothetical protein sscle_09g069930 [Sclerotinia sclerotiorum 1980 UF-70]